MLSVHYRHPVNFAQELVESAANGLDRILTAYSNLQHRLSISADLAEDSQQWIDNINEQITAFETAMDDDFNTANAIAVIFELSKQANIYLLEKNTDRHVLQQFIDALDRLMGVLGLPFDHAEELLDEDVDELIQERLDARKNRDFARADEIRDELKAKGIILEDTAQGIRWKRG